MRARASGVAAIGGWPAAEAAAAPPTSPSLTVEGQRMRVGWWGLGARVLRAAAARARQFCPDHRR